MTIQQVNPNNAQEVLNDPEVLYAFQVLIERGLLFVPQRATIFCAYCGEHICYDVRRSTDDLASKQIEPRHSEFTSAAVAVHRQTCTAYQVATALTEDTKAVEDGRGVIE